MQAIKPSKLGLLATCYERDRQRSLAVSAIAFFPLGEATLLPETGMWPFLTQRLGETVLDEAMPKVNAEVLVDGSVYAPGSEPVTATEVSFQVGELTKRLAVFGDRLWDGDQATEPEPFTEGPLSWELAFGGEGFEPNPAGLGFAAIETEDGPVHFLPNIEDPEALIVSPEDRPAPAGVGPGDPNSPQRTAKLGTYDEEWLEDLYPGFARDFDPTYFNVAPPDQQQGHPFRGDEPLVFRNLHPERPLLEGRLPGVRARCFVVQRTEVGELFTEVELALDTIWLFPDAERGVLIFHGQVPIAEEDGSDIARLMLAAEWLGEPRAVEHYQAAMAKRLDDEEGSLHALVESDLLPSGLVPSQPLDQAGELDEGYGSRGLLRQNMQRKLRREREAQEADLRARGLDPAAHLPPPPPEDGPMPTLEEMPELIKALSREAELNRQAAEKRQEQAREEARARFAALGLDLDEIERRQSSGPPRFTAAAQLERDRDAAAAARSRGLVLTDLEARLEDPGYHAQLQEREEQARDGYRRMAHFRYAVDPLDEARSEGVRGAVAQATAAGESLARSDLTGADLSGLDLSGADLREAFLEGVDLRGANLAGADLTRAVLTRSQLKGANLEGASLVEANLGDTELTGVSLERVALAGAILTGSDLRGASFAGSLLDEADLTEAAFGDTDFTGASLAGALFREADLRGCSFRGADLSSCVFMESDLTGADFTEATLDQATFVGAALQGATFCLASLRNVPFVSGTVLDEADFRRACLYQANLRETSARRCDFSGATLESSDLSGADLEEAAFFEAVARGARFAGANLRRARLESANLMGGSLRGADLRGANLSDTNLHGADLALIWTDDDTDLTDALRTQTIEYPKRPA